MVPYEAVPCPLLVQPATKTLASQRRESDKRVKAQQELISGAIAHGVIGNQLAPEAVAYHDEAAGLGASSAGNFNTPRGEPQARLANPTYLKRGRGGITGAIMRKTMLALSVAAAAAFSTSASAQPPNYP